jgi:hypothetical protein
LYCYYEELNALTGNVFPSQKVLESEPRNIPFGLGMSRPECNKFVCQNDGIEFIYNHFILSRQAIDTSLEGIGWQMFELSGGYYRLGLVKAEKEPQDLLATIERQQKAIEAYEEQLDKAAEILDVYLIQRYGEDEAWEHHVGNEVAPDYVVAEVEQDKDLWALREQINSTLHWEQRRLEGDSDICD